MSRPSDTCPEYCSDLRFEASYLKSPVWRLNDVSFASDAVKSAIENDVALISARIFSNELRFVKKLMLSGFYKVETLITLERAISGEPKAISGVRIATQKDADAAAKIASSSFNFDRFHADPNISNDIADQIKSGWARNAILGRADSVLVVENNGNVLGFNACLLRENAAIIDLIAIEASMQGKGYGKRLIDAMAYHYKDKVKVLRLGTQETNKQSIKFYKKLGFKVVERHDTYHWVPNAI